MGTLGRAPLQPPQGALQAPCHSENWCRSVHVWVLDDPRARGAGRQPVVV